MKRRLFKLVLFLTLGAVVNVAVALWFAISFDSFDPTLSSKMGTSFDGPGYTQWDVCTLNRLRGTWVLSEAFNYRLGYSKKEMTAEEALPYWAESLKPDPYAFEANPSASWITQQAMAHGWPFLSMVKSWDEQGGNDYSSLSWQAISWQRDEPLIVWRTGAVLWPVEIIWPGFAINTIFYAIAIWILTLGPFTARRMIRRKRGLCIKCGYDLRGNSGGSGGEVCPECGFTNTAPKLLNS